jgi:hypothetical protein
MNPDGNSLETGYDSSAYSSSLEASSTVPSVSTTQAAPKLPYKARRLNIPLFRLNKVAFFITFAALTLIVFIGGAFLIYDKVHHNKALNSTSTEANGTYKVGGSLSVQQASDAALLQLGQVNKLSVNGQLSVSNSVVLNPSSAPSTPVAGQIYYNQASNAPYYYNGSQFISLSPTVAPEHVTSLGGVAGVLGLGAGLSVNGGNLSISSSVLQSLSSVPNTPIVDSIQGLTGNVSFTGGQGVTISGTTISNSGVINLTSSNNSINISNSGNGTYDLTLAGGGGVILGPNAAQDDTSNNPSVYINKTGTGDLLDLQSNGADAFVVSQTGQITTGTIDYSQVQGRPATVVTDIDGESGSIAVGTGISIAGNSLSNSGVVSISGTANQVIASASSGSLTLSLPQDIATTSSPTFDNQTLNGGLSVGGVAALNGGATADSLNVSGGTTLQGATTEDNSFAVQGSLTVGVPGSIVGNLYLSTGSANEVDLTGETPSGTGTGTIQFPTIPGGTSDTVCLESKANCGSSSDTVTTSSAGTPGTIAEFTGADSIANSSITDNGSTVTIGELLTAGTITANTLESSGALDINPGGNLTIGATNHTLDLQGSSSSYFAESANGYTDTLEFTAPTTANNVITIPDATGTVCLDNSTACGFASGGSGVTSLDTLRGALSIYDTSGSGSDITLQSASTTQAGIAEFNSSDFQVTGSVTDGGNIIDTIQGISTTSNVQFVSLGLGTTCTSGNLCLGTTGTVNAANLSNTSSTNNLVINGGSQNVLFENDSGANTFTLPNSGGTGQQICVEGGTCATGGGLALILEPTSVQNVSSNRNSIFVDKTGGTGDLVDLQTGSSQNALVIDGSGNATFSNTTTAAALDVSGILQANTITPSGALTVGSTSQSFTVQGSESSEILGSGSGNSTYVGFGTPTGNTITAGSIYYDFDNSAAQNTSGSPYFICTTAGNCSGSGGSVTALGGSTGDVIPLFSTTAGTGGNIEDSILSETGSNTIVVGGNLSVGTSGYGQLSLGVASTSNGTLVVNNSTNSNTFTIQQAAAPSSNVTLDLPTTSGTFAVAASSPLALNATTGVLTCPGCLTGSGPGGGVTSLNTLSGAITINNATTSGQNIQLNYAKADGSTLGIATFNSTNFTDNGTGVINTVQNIATTSSPTFSNLTVQGTTGLTLGSAGGNDGQEIFLDGSGDGHTQTISQATLTGNQTLTVPNSSGTLADSASGNLSLSALGNLTITSSPTFSSSVTTPLLESSGSLSITPGGSLTAGSTTQSFTLQGNGSSSITATSGSDTTSIEFDTPTAANTIYIPNQGGTVCLDNSTACGFAGSGNYILNQTTQQTGANIDIQSASGSVAAKIQGASGQNILDLFSSASSSTPVAYFDSAGDLIVTTNDINGATITGGTLSGGTVSGGTLSSTAVNGLTVSGGTITSPNITGTVTGSSSPTITGFGTYNGQTISSAASFTGTVGVATGLTVSAGGITDTGNILQNGAGTFTTGTGNVSLNGATTIVANQNLTLSSGTGVFSQTYVSTATGSQSARTLSVTNSNATSTATTVNGDSISLVGTNNTNAGENVLNGINFNNVTPTTNNTFNGLNFGTGYTNLLQSANVTITAAGAVTAGTYNGQTISSAASFTGTVGVATGLTVGSTGNNGTLTLNNGTSGDQVVLQANGTQATSATISFPAITASDTVCLQNKGNCSGSNGGSGDTSYIFNTTTAQSPGNIDIISTASAVAATLEGASGQNILNLLSSSGGSPVADFTSTGELVVSNNDINGATITGGTLSGGTVSGGTLTSTAVNGLNVSGGTIASPTISGTITGSSSPTITGFGTYDGATLSGGTLSGGNISGGNLSANQLQFTTTSNTITESTGNSSLTVNATGTGTLTLDTTGAGTVDIGNTNATTIQVGSTSLSSGTQTINIGNNNTAGGTTNILIGTGTSALGTLTLQAASGISIANSTLTQTYATSGTGNSAITQTASLNASSGTNSLNGYAIQLNGHSTSGTNTLNGINLTVGGAISGNVFNGLNFGTGYTNLLQSANVTITAAGAITAGNYNSQTISSAANLTGSLTVASMLTVNGGTLDLGSTGTFPGNLVLASSATTSGTVTLSADMATGTSGSSYVLDLPTSAPTIASTGQCLNASANVGGSTYQLSYTGCGVSGSHSANIEVPAEYAGAVLDAAGDSSCSSADIGTMTSADTDLGITSPYDQNYYEWTTSQSSTECYDVVVQVPLPSDFSSFSTTAGPSVFAEASGASSQVYVEPLTCSGTLDNNYGGYQSISPGTSLASTPFGDTLTSTPSSYTSCGYLTLRFRLVAGTSGGTAEIGNITIPYTTGTAN